ncbi:MAG TPA: hypothetical protein PKK30_12315 [Nitrospira sp.]|nr:hypothetical protein [Accumulibacter sp.]HNE14075.1 hypothetical protein [Accumulibacter sp.]HNL15076.1 hypothetical protein [Accumulibacter sp.]HNO35096.1 hypothetical protein [Nitrospira sp.]
MPKPQATDHDAVGRFWDRFRDNLLRKGVKADVVRYCVRQAEQYLQAFAGWRLAEHTADGVNGYLQSLGREGKLEDWQFVQAVGAIQNLIETAGAPAAKAVDWPFWRNSARSLAPSPPTRARESATMDEPVSGESFKVKHHAPSSLDRVREAHGVLGAAAGGDSTPPLFATDRAGVRGLVVSVHRLLQPGRSGRDR